VLLPLSIRSAVVGVVVVDGGSDGGVVFIVIITIPCSTRQ
jgi:hypothetical protein